MNDFLIIYPSYFEQFLTIAIIHLLAVISPGPDFIVVVKQSNYYGRKSALFTSSGIALGIIVHVIYCIVGIGYFISQYSLLFSSIKFIGALYLFYLGFKSLLIKNNKFKNSLKSKNGTARLNRKSFYIGFITNIFNPKATLFFLSLFAVVINQDTPLMMQIIYGIWMSVVTGIWFCLVTLIFTSKFSEIFISKYALIIDKIMGIVLMVISIKLILF